MDAAQQAFSAAKAPSLHEALPAIEALYSAWDKQSKKAKYAHFADALNTTTAKLDDYYTKTAASDTHILAMNMCFISYYGIL